MRKDIVPIWLWVLIWLLLSIGIYIEFETTLEILTGISIPTIIMPIAAILNRKYE